MRELEVLVEKFYRTSGNVEALGYCNRDRFFLNGLFSLCQHQVYVDRNKKH